MTLEDEYWLVVSKADAKRHKTALLQSRHLYYDRNVKESFNVRSIYQERSDRLRSIFEGEYPELAEFYEYLGVWAQGFQLWTSGKKDPRKKLNELAEEKRNAWW